ncbi:MAG: ABC transporter substrate-binding protein [Actinomycetota bacterium]
MMSILRERGAWAALLMALLVVAAGCGSTGQVATPSESPTAGFGSDVAVSDVLPPGAHVTKEGKVVNKKGKVIGTAEEFGLEKTKSGKYVAEDDSGRGKPKRSRGAGPANPATDPSELAGEIKLGVVVPSGNAGAAFGVNANYGDNNQRYAQAMIEEINATGGLAGRKVVGVYAEMDQTDQSQADETREGNEICTRLTEDEHVFLVVTFVLWARHSFDCYARHQTPIWPSVNNIDAEGMQELQPWLLPSLWMSYTRMAKLMPVAYQQAGAITEKMGLVGFDLPDLRRATEEILIPGLEARGGVVLDKIYVPPEYQSAASIAQAVLRFNQQGIDRVVFFAPGGAAWLIFGREADAQDYRPGYNVSSYDNANYIEGLLPRSQLEKTVGAGYRVQYDVTESAQPDARPIEEECWRIMKERAGVEINNRNQTPNPGLHYCDAFWLLQTALSPARGKQFDPPDVAGLYFSVGSRFAPSLMLESFFTPKRTDGVSLYAPFKFYDGCGCFKYTSNYRRMSF